MSSAHQHYGISKQGRNRTPLALEVLIADADMLFISLLGQIFKNFGVVNLHYANSTSQAIDELSRSNIDLVITDWDLPTEHSHSTIVQQMRQHSNSKIHKAPIIVLTANDNINTVKLARDSGTNSFLLKPLNIRMLCKRIRDIIDNPRPFIQSPNYTGPSRRRQEAIPEGGDRRMSEEEKEKRSTREGDCTVIDMEEYKLRIHDADTSIRRKIGEAVKLSDIFNNSIIQDAEEKLATAHKNLQGDAVAHLQKIFSELEKSTEKQNFDYMSGNLRMPIQKLSQSANNLGYFMAMNAASSMMRYLEALGDFTEERAMVLHEHASIMNVVFTQQMQGAGGDQGEQLRDYLEQLTKHYAPS